MFELTTIPARGTIEWEAARVAKAFGVEAFTWSFRDDRIYWGDTADYVGQARAGHRVSWVFDSEGKFSCLTLSDGEGFKEWVQFGFYANEWTVSDSDGGDNLKELMARGLYRLGFSDESALEQLPALSNHEKLELRLSMPREFWPEAWEKEMEAASTTLSV